MKQSIFENKALQFIVRFLTGLSFALFIAYQVVLVFAISSARMGRILGIACFLMICVSCFLMISQNTRLDRLRSLLFVVGTIMLFSIKFLNVEGLFGILSFSNPTSVMNCAVFILSEAGTALLFVYFLTIKNDRENSEKRVTTFILMSIVIVLFVACLIMESVMLIKYRVNIDIRLKYTLLSRFAYCAGFVGMAIGFMLPARKEEAEAKEGEFIYSEDVDDEIDMVM